MHTSYLKHAFTCPYSVHGGIFWNTNIVENITIDYGPEDLMKSVVTSEAPVPSVALIKSALHHVDSHQVIAAYHPLQAFFLV